MFCAGQELLFIVIEMDLKLCRCNFEVFCDVHAFNCWVSSQNLKNKYMDVGGQSELIIVYIYIYTGCPRRNVKYFGRVFLMLNYTDITQNTYIQS